MRGLLKILSVLEMLIGIGCGIVAVAGLVASGLISDAATLPLEQQAVTLIRVSAIFGLLSAVFNFACGFCGLKGATPGNEGPLSAAVKLGWLGLIAAVASAVLMLVGDLTVGRALSALCSCVLPVLFLISAKSVRDER